MKSIAQKGLAILTATALTLSLGACGTAPSSSTSSSTASTVTSSSSSAAASVQASAEAAPEVSGKVTMVTTGVEYPEVMDALQAAYPDMEFIWEQQGSGTFTDTYKTRLSAGAEGLDIFTPARADYPVLAKAGQLLDITGKDYLNNYTDGVIDSATVDGKVYGVPVTANCYIVWYNKDLFKQYNLEQPTTLEEFETVCATLKENGVVPMVSYAKTSSVIQLAALAYHDLLSQDPEWLSKLSTGEAKWTDEGSVAALERLKSWIDKGYILDGSLSLDDTQAYQAFYQGQAAMLHNGTWSIDKLAEAAPEFEVGVFPYLAAEGTANRAQYCPGSIWAVASESSNAAAAEAVIEWISQPENAQQYCTVAKQFGTVKGVSFDFDPAAANITPFYEMDKTNMMHAYVTSNAKTELTAYAQKMLAKDASAANVADVAAAIQAGQDKDNAA